MTRPSLVSLVALCAALAACSGGGGGGGARPPDPALAGRWGGTVAGGSPFVARLAGPNGMLEGYVDDAAGVIWSAVGSGAGGDVGLTFDAPGWLAFSLDGTYSASPGGNALLADVIDGTLQGSGFTGQALHAERTGAPPAGIAPLNRAWSFSVFYRSVPTAPWAWWLDGIVSSGTQTGSTFNGRVAVTDDGISVYGGSIQMIAAPSGFVSTTFVMDSNPSWVWNKVVVLETGYVETAGLHGYGIDAGDEIRMEGVP